MNCKELVYLLGDYFDGSMEPHLREELAEHIKLCDVCTRFLKTYDKTRILCRSLRYEEIPSEVREKLKSFVVQRAREHRADIEQYRTRTLEERQQFARQLVDRYATGDLPPAMTSVAEQHARHCPACAPFLRAGAVPPASIPDGVVDHLADLAEELPPGEAPFGE
jgi:anti-sigma factor RsiW